jgi:hypothetical protein
MSEVSQSEKEILEALAALVVVGKFGRAVLADGKVSVADLPALIALVKDQGAIVSGVQGLGQISIKELDGEAAIRIVSALVSGYKELAA